MANYDWVNFYKELSIKLLAYKDNRSELVNKIMHAFNANDINLPTLENGELIDIDPFTVFGLFNKTNITNVNRIKIINALKGEFGINAITPDSFDGIPVVYAQKATYYRFINDERGEHDIDNLWGLFECAINYSYNYLEDSFEKLKYYFNLCINLKYNALGKITMGLFWINPKKYLNLDSVNIDYIYESGIIDKKIVSDLPTAKDKLEADKYFEIVNKIDTAIKNKTIKEDSFLTLSYNAWTYSKEKKLEEKKKEENESTNSDTIRYWLISPGEKCSKWDNFKNNNIISIASGFLGNLNNYKSEKEIQKAIQDYYKDDKSHKNDKCLYWNFKNVMKPNDIVFVKGGLDNILAAAVVESNYKFDNTIEDDYKNIRDVKWLKIEKEVFENLQFNQKGLTDITNADYLEELKLRYLSEEEVKVDNTLKYTKENFLNEVFMDLLEYNRLSNLLMREKNIILQGAPGVGKTFIAKRLAYSLLGEKDNNKVEMVQFHQSYSYEDFIMGYRPNENNSFKLEEGIFYKFCNKAKNDPNNKYFFIIDEINRGNLSKIFGELLMLIEADKRGQEISLIYNKELFSVPENIYIIGMMNTADRSLTTIDYALRRRFSFFTINPAFDNQKFIEYQNTINNNHFNSLINVVKQLNETIKNDPTLGKGFMIGHSYLSNLDYNVSDEQLYNIVEYKLIPLIEEYWFDEDSKVYDWSEKLRGSIND